MSMFGNKDDQHNSLTEELIGEISRLGYELKQVKADRMILALRLYGEDFDTFAPETREVMERMNPEIQRLF